MSCNSAFQALSQLESNIADVERWGNTLIAIGTTDAHVDPGVVLVLGWALKQLGDDLDIEWRTAFEAAGGKP